MLRRALLLAPLAASKCYRVEESGTTTTLSFEHSMLWMLTGGALLALVVGIVLSRRKSMRRVGVAFITAAAFAGVLFVPMMWMDRVVITPTEIRQKTGFWFIPTRKGFRYADVSSVTIRDVQAGRRRYRVWSLALTDGGESEVKPGTLWDSNQDLVVEKLRGFGVRFR